MDGVTNGGKLHIIDAASTSLVLVLFVTLMPDVKNNRCDERIDGAKYK